jgi:hypothetical protein
MYSSGLRRLVAVVKQSYNVLTMLFVSDIKEPNVNYSRLKPGSLPLALHDGLCIQGVWVIDCTPPAFVCWCEVFRP